LKYTRQYYKENREQISEYKKQYHKENREKRLEYIKQWRQENPEYNKQWYQENRGQKLEYNRQWYQGNREKRLEYNKQWYQENREHRLDYKKQYRQENPEKMAVLTAKRRALKRDSIPDALTNCPEEKDRVDKIYKLRELLTKATGVQHHVDHIWPLSKGGPHWSGNLQIITAEENLSKGDTLCEETARVIQESLDEYCSARQ